MKRIQQIRPLDAAAKEQAREQWNRIAKPLHSLGLLEEAVIQIAGIIQSADVRLDKRCAVAMCADNGVLCERVAQSDSNVTAAVAKAMAEGSSNVNLMGKPFRVDVLTVDIGMAEDVAQERLIQRKISYGTNNIAAGPAMTRQQAIEAITVGMDMVKHCREQGYQILVTGEMGIGNTTTSAAIASMLLHMPAAEVTGRGAGLSREGLERKVQVIERAIRVNQPDAEDAMDLIARLGGYDIAGMTGLYLGGAVYRIPVVIDGFISAVAAALAAKIHPQAADYMLASHVSKEPAGRKMLELLGKKPLICAEMCLGEGTGGVLLLPMLDAALEVYHSIHSFEQIAIEQYKELDGC